MIWRNKVELYAIKYGESSFNMKFIYQDMASSGETTEFAWLYYLVKYNGKVILFDTGFRNRHESSKWGVTFKNIEAEISKLIDGPASVDVVFITHSHFDHIDNLDLYENASIIIAKEECQSALKKAPRTVKKRLKQADVIQVTEEYVYDDKFCFKVIGGHSTGSSVIYFNDNSNFYVITGDECYFCDNLSSLRPIGVYADIHKNTTFIKDAQEKGLIPLTFHDPKIFDTYKHISENIVRII